MEESKQFGKYDGGILKDPSYPKICSEAELYNLIQNYGGVIWRLNHAMSHGRISEPVDMVPYQYLIEYCVMQTPRFGVEIEEPKEGEHVVAGKSYWNWFSWWDHYFQHLTTEEFEDYLSRVANGEDISMYRPEGDWREITNQ